MVSLLCTPSVTRLRKSDSDELSDSQAGRKRGCQSGERKDLDSNRGLMVAQVPRNTGALSILRSTSFMYRASLAASIL